MDQLIEIPGDRTASRLAYAAAATGAIGVVTLGAMFAVEVPRGGPFVFGTINDATGAVFNAVVIPVILQVHRRVPPAPWTEPIKWVTVSSCAAGAASSALLVFKVLDFNSSTAISIASITLQGAWFYLIHNRLQKVDEYPRTLSRLGRAIGGAMLVGLPIAGIGYASQGPEWLRTALMGAGTAVGAAAWVAWPYWYFRAGRYFSHKLHHDAAPATFPKAAG
ncbi:hypothetical protein F8G81_05690 [Arthrobacter sp. CDRTa11]|uniref:hypothetical protein n=1 Tax=Arthrobacter sp. CDRTa11 TaxID=2651199 RepID=UPI0022659736|nr:hypothetical protein [Arthrobacter sp. CDRTa11]UZX02165.1 hypothetical protein F8G81_05690 [Arthrobacter sp. CDRTa11]